MRTLLHSTTIITPTSAAAPTTVLHSPWHSPVSYLFGGLAAMTGLIAFALLILACSYCHLTRAAADDETRRRHGDVEQGKNGEQDGMKVSPVFEEKFLVIMAGHDLPTFVATPMFSKASLVAPEKNQTKIDGNGDLRDEKNKEEDEIEETEHVCRGDIKSLEESSTDTD